MCCLGCGPGGEGFSTVRSSVWSTLFPSVLILAPLTFLWQQLPSSPLSTQQAAAEGEQLSWLSEKRLLLQRLDCLERAVARLELEKTALEQFNAELRRTLEQVKQAVTASAKPHGRASEHSTFPQTALWSPLLVSFPLLLSPVASHCGVFSLCLLAPPCLHKCSFTPVPPFLPQCPSPRGFEALASGTAPSCSSAVCSECFLPGMLCGAMNCL